MNKALFLLLITLTSCIGTKPFGFRKVEFTAGRLYYGENVLKEEQHTRRIYIKDCPRCKEILIIRKKELAEDGKLLYKERMKRRMYTAKLYRLKSKLYYENGHLKEERKFNRGKGWVKRYDGNGDLIDKKKLDEKNADQDMQP
jgi:antitoxin component YwqK of YwqJK toxin-antitoxin module